MSEWKRQKEIPSKSTNLKTSCGTLNITFGYENDRLIELWAIVGKSGSCANTLLASFCKVASMLLQSSQPKYKIVKKFRKQFVDSNCGMPFSHEGKQYKGCVDYIAQKVVEELDK